jgi:two-component system sensor histidine kinase MprB
LQDRVSGLVSAAVVAAIAVTGIAAYLFTTITVYSQLDSELIEVAQLTGEWIASDPEGMGGLNSDALKAANATVSLVRADGTTKNPPGSEAVLESSAEEMAVARLQVGSSARSGTDSQGTAFRIVAVPIHSDGRNYALILGRPLDSTFQILQIMGYTLLTFGVLAAIIASVVGYLIARSSLQPLQRLNQAVAHVTRTDQLDPISLAGMDELTDLATSFNTMMSSLSQSRSRQRQLIDDAGHELRTPLTALRTNVELLVADEKAGMLPEGARAEILRDIAAQLGEFSALIGDLVHLSRDELITSSPEPVDFAEVVRRALERARRRGPGLNYDVELESFYLVGDPDSLERAITNLLDNAVKFSPPGGTVTVRLHGDRLTVADEGPGVDPADMPHIFDRFYRSDKSRNTPGSGLGLSIVDQTIRAHGGWVRAGNRESGGAIFTVRLPGSPEPPPDLP